MTSLPFDRLAFARGIIRAEAASLDVVAGRLDDGFDRVAELLAHCRGRTAVTGIGKSADVGQKIAGTLNSTGTRAYVLDASKAMHGDLGAVHPDDIVLMLSHSGESDELVRLLGPLRRMAGGIAAITARADSTLARSADAAVVYGPVTEACPLALAPSSSTTVMLALGDALAFTLSEDRQFTADDFARFHPAGTLGRKLAAVEGFMRRGSELRIAPDTETVRNVFARVRHHGRRTGAIMLVNEAGELAGLFTDSDLARIFEDRADAALDAPIAYVMTRRPVVVRPESRVQEVIDLMRGRKISEVPVVDEQARPIGMIDITDLIGLEPEETEAPGPAILRMPERLSA